MTGGAWDSFRPITGNGQRGGHGLDPPPLSVSHYCPPASYSRSLPAANYSYGGGTNYGYGGGPNWGYKGAVKGGGKGKGKGKGYGGIRTRPSFDYEQKVAARDYGPEAQARREAIRKVEMARLGISGTTGGNQLTQSIPEKPEEQVQYEAPLAVTADYRNKLSLLQCQDWQAGRKEKFRLMLQARQEFRQICEREMAQAQEAFPETEEPPAEAFGAPDLETSATHDGAAAAGAPAAKEPRVNLYIVTADFDPSDYGEEYLMLCKGETLLVMEDYREEDWGFATKVPADYQLNTPAVDMPSGWYPPRYAKLKG